MNMIFSWCGILGLVLVPFVTGVIFEQKLQTANRELGAPLLRRY